MPTVPLYPPNSTSRPKNLPATSDSSCNPLPQLLQTPSGLAILEIQGTINLPSRQQPSDTVGDELEEGHDSWSESPPQFQTPIGRLSFPDYDAANSGGGGGGGGDDASSDDSWRKRVHLYVGRYQRLTGEVKKLPKPLAVIQRRQTDQKNGAAATTTATTTTTTTTTARPQEQSTASDDGDDELEVVEIVKHKIIFSSRPEPFGDMTV